MKKYLVFNLPEVIGEKSICEGVILVSIKGKVNIKDIKITCNKKGVYALDEIEKYGNKLNNILKKAKKLEERK